MFTAYLKEGCQHGQQEEVGHVQQAARHRGQLLVWGQGPACYTTVDKFQVENLHRKAFQVDTVDIKRKQEFECGFFSVSYKLG